MVRPVIPTLITEEIMVLARINVKFHRLSSMGLEAIAATLTSVPAHQRASVAEMLKRSYGRKDAKAVMDLKHACNFDQQCSDGAIMLAKAEEQS